MVALGFYDGAQREHLRHWLINVVMALTEFISGKLYTSESPSELSPLLSRNAVS